MRIGSRRLWRSVVSCLAAYALVLHSVLVAFAGAPLGAAPTDPAFEICAHLADGTPVLPSGAPAGHDGQNHCKLCVTAGPHALAAPAPSPLRLVLVGTITVGHFCADADVPPSPHSLSDRPRGPPHAT